MYYLKKIDREYCTQERKEVFYLIDHGVPFIFVKTDENNVTTWKFKKGKRLFELLTDFYSNRE